MVNTQIITPRGTSTNAGTSFARSPPLPPAIPTGAAVPGGDVVKTIGRLGSDGEVGLISRVAKDEMDVAALPLPLMLAVRCS